MIRKITLIIAILILISQILFLDFDNLFDFQINRNAYIRVLFVTIVVCVIFLLKNKKQL